MSNFNERLKNSLKERNFNSFFECFHFLITTGLNQIDAFALTLSHYEGNENKIWENVAYIRFKYKTVKINNPLNDLAFHENEFWVNEEPKNYFIIGIINDENRVLSGLFDVYRKSFCENSLDTIELISDSIENYCPVKLTFDEFDSLLFKYLNNTFIKHFGYDLIPIINNKPNYKKLLSINERIRDNY